MEVHLCSTAPGRFEQFLETPFYGSRQMARWLRPGGLIAVSREAGASYAAAKQLDLVEDGVVPIEITVVVWEPSREIGHRAAAAGPVDDETGA